jgi:hypothetical protein
VRRVIVAWLAFWAGFGLLDYWADRRGKSLCTATRHLFRTHTPAGRVTFTGAFTAGALILHRHLLKEALRND